MTRTGTVVLVLFLALASLEAWRLSVPTKAAFTETWHLETPSGPMTVSGPFVLVQHGVIPYLPGGEFGRHDVQGANLAFVLFGDRLEARPFGPQELHQMARRLKVVKPAVSLDGLANEYTIGFVRRIKRALMEIDVQVKDTQSVTEEGFLAYWHARDLTLVRSLARQSANRNSQPGT